MDILKYFKTKHPLNNALRNKSYLYFAIIYWFING